jgi:hypothetical protein
MHYKGVTASHLPSFLLPCPHCGNRMAITAVAPAQYANGAESDDLEDVTHACVQCGTTLISTRPLSGDSQRHDAPAALKSGSGGALGRPGPPPTQAV